MDTGPESGHTGATAATGSVHVSLTSTWADAWEKQYGLGPGWFVNTQPNDRIPLGLKGRLLGDTFQQSGPLAQLAALLPPQPPAPDNSGWQFQSSSGIHFDGAVAGSTAAPIDWLGGAKAGVKASFAREAGVLALGTHKWFHRFGDMDQVRAALRQAVADGDLVEGDAVIAELQLTGKGVLFVSQGGEASIEVLAGGSVAPAGTTLAEFSGHFNVARQQGAVAMEQYGDGSTIAARVMKVAIAASGGGGGS